MLYRFLVNVLPHPTCFGEFARDYAAAHSPVARLVGARITDTMAGRDAHSLAAGYRGDRSARVDAAHYGR